MLDPWQVDDSAFPHEGTTCQKLHFLLNYAVLAPSGHNSQPWLFRVHDDEVELLADRTRALPVVDPHDREMLISCGAALFHLRLAMRRFGFEPEIQVFPDPEDPDLLARIALEDSHNPTPEEKRLFEVIPERRTNRQTFEDRSVPGELWVAVKRASEQEGVWFCEITEDERRHELADLVAQADRVQAADPAFRRELAAWVHPNRSQSRDGMPGYAHGLGDIASFVGPFILRTFDWGKGQAAKDRQIALGSPALAVLGTDEDTPRAWLATGQALASVLLHACAEGVSVSYLNQPIEVPELRPRLLDLVGHDGYPQILLRMGYGPKVQPTPRRSVNEAVVGRTHNRSTR